MAFDKGEITFNKKIVYSIQILGTFSHFSETWLWGWANPDSNFPEKILNHARGLKEYGNSHGIDFLTKDQFEIEHDYMHYIGLIAVGMFGVSGYYLGDYGRGTYVLDYIFKGN